MHTEALPLAAPPGDRTPCAISPHVGDLGLPAALALSAGEESSKLACRRGCPQWPPRETKGGAAVGRGEGRGERTRRPRRRDHRSGVNGRSLTFIFAACSGGALVLQRATGTHLRW